MKMKFTVAKAQMQENAEKGIFDYKDLKEYSTNLAKYFFAGRVESLDRLKVKNPNLDASNLEVAEASQDEGSEDPEIKSFDQEHSNADLPSNDPIVPSTEPSKDDPPQPSIWKDVYDFLLFFCFKFEDHSDGFQAIYCVCNISFTLLVFETNVCNSDFISHLY